MRQAAYRNDTERRSDLSLRKTLLDIRQIMMFRSVGKDSDIGSTRQVWLLRKHLLKVMKSRLDIEEGNAGEKTDIKQP
jgi:hypothetical protein